MTTTQPAALPELPPLTGDIQIQDRTIYVLNKKGENVWWASVQPGFHDNGIRVSEDQCRAIAADLAILAALQPKPAAAVSDAEIKRVCDQHGISPRSYVLAFARAILALRPQAVPMTPGQMRTLVVDCGYDHASTQERADFINGVRTGERWHRITAQGAQGEQA